jgi:hypothetical protein
MGRPNLSSSSKLSRGQHRGRLSRDAECRAVIEKTPLGHIEVVGDHNAALPPPVPDARPPHQGGCLKADQQMDERKNKSDHGPACARASKAICDQSHSNQVDDQDKPQAVPYHPQRSEQKSSGIEPFMQEDAPVGLFGRRLSVLRWL